MNSEIGEHFKLEIGEDSKSSICHCCGRKSFTGHGFIYKNDDAYAVYYAGWAPGHSLKKVTFAIAIGEWDDDSTVQDRICFGLEAYEDKEEILLRVIEPSDSPWKSTELLGKMIFREEALNNPYIQEVYDITELIIRKHEAIKEYLAVSA
jgi:hypothetical protein